ncbi:MAG: 1,6-anhydro-N-acetylmuramyl-L-alanine amidase AmpD [Zoogloeaceae bacterium]|jgi:AmpD protein|nr:1,6-anhydro-N-acetylmuramyl-L-alanine amidase AmpD [Zoogloeaceae bacterium]
MGVEFQEGQEGWFSSARRVASPNFDARPADAAVSLIVLHGISLPPETFGGPYVAALFTNTLEGSAHPYFARLVDTRVSAHFFIRRDGDLTQFVSTADRAWHAGKSRWQGRENCNDFSIGVELEGSARQAFTADQYAALWPLLAALCARYPIRAIVGHEHIAPGRKTDPGPHFDWPALAERFSRLETPPQHMRASASRERGNLD